MGMGLERITPQGLGALQRLDALPQDWLAAHVLEILERITVDWNDGFEFYNLCAAFYHAPEILTQILEYAKNNMPAKRAEEWISDMDETMRSQGHYKTILEEYERINNMELIGLR